MVLLSFTHGVIDGRLLVMLELEVLPVPLPLLMCLVLN